MKTLKHWLEQVSIDKCDWGGTVEEVIAELKKYPRNWYCIASAETPAATAQNQAHRAAYVAKKAEISPDASKGQS